ncbi:MAG: RidA family protein [Verrucomicrobiae bacterium]|nr:RidA family protein [Verrucomicrobiae bacterium]
MEIINAPAAPAAVGPYSHAVRLGSLLFCSGQVPLSPEDGKLVGETVEPQTHQVFANIKAVLASQGLSLDNVVKTTVFLQSMSDFPAMNAIYSEHFGSHKPARSTVEVAKLPLGALVEIECIAAFEG